MNKYTQNMTPVKLRIILSISMVVIVIIGIGGVLAFRNYIVSYANQVSEDNAKAAFSKENVQQLKKLDKQLSDDKVAVTRAASIVADDVSHRYQDTIINDLNTYAARSNLKISSYTFVDDSGSASAPAAADPNSAIKPIAGIKTVSLNVSLETPVGYESFMQFLRAIELNLTKIQITSMSITRDPSTGQTAVGPLSLEVYVR